ncbi:MAG: cell division ATP-binding protein FtsE [Parcubacteria group bacterium]|uniref:Cell division ATP-binding protein FtsE n=1 Tax=Candidatus Sungiibacteriota bacterium TaxID=2750080 RepID=A0A931YD32_9BACT|nr:cell division ATP-binding protein FtsE [Candidatus Sungbacteria bacterium]MBI4118923.1 cell division ATP-binding protein FtsE [Parcubacteria group bacterium]
MIHFKNISKIYPPHMVALENVNLIIKAREFVSLVGSSGAGKSTLLRMLIGEEAPTMGEIIVGDVSINSLDHNELPYLRRKIGTVFQDYKLLAGKTVYENIAFAMEVAGKDELEIKEDVPQVLGLVGLEDKINQFPYQLSGGEKQRVAIGRALVHRPDILVADEPTGNLDPVNTWEVVNLLLKLNELGATVILATHDNSIVNNLARRVVLMDKGRIIKDDEKGKYLI